MLIRLLALLMNPNLQVGRHVIESSIIAILQREADLDARQLEGWTTRLLATEL